MHEIWKDIKGYESLYQISNLGRIMSKSRIIKYSNGIVKNHTGKILNVYMHNSGYYFISLRNKRIRKNHFIHRLVAAHFVANPNNKPQVNHKDGNKLNNYYKNLEWVTASENGKHAYKNGLSKLQFGINASQSKLTESDVLDIRNMYGSRNYSYNELANIFKVSSANIVAIVKRKTWNHL